jgi:hypothetical protein
VTERGALWLYAAAFTLLVVAGAVFVVASRGFLNSLRLLWFSAGLSVAAILASLSSLFLPRVFPRRG